MAEGKLKNGMPAISLIYLLYWLHLAHSQGSVFLWCLRDILIFSLNVKSYGHFEVNNIDKSSRFALFFCSKER